MPLAPSRASRRGFAAATDPRSEGATGRLVGRPDRRAGVPRRAGLDGWWRAIYSAPAGRAALTTSAAGRFRAPTDPPRPRPEERRP